MTLKEKWAEYEAHVLKDADPMLRIHMRRAFYLGAGSVVNLAAQNDKNPVEILNSISEETNEYFEALRRKTPGI